MVKRILMKTIKNWPFLLQHDTSTPRRRSACLGVELRLGELEPKFYEFSGPPRCRNASPRRTSPPRRSIASLRLTCSRVLVPLFR